MPNRANLGLSTALALLVSVYCLGVIWHTLGFGAATLDVPIMYESDALQYSYVVDAFAEGSLADIKSTAAPFGTQHRDFPNADIANMSLMAVLGPHENFGLQFNLFFLATVVLTSISAFMVARASGLSLPWACLAAVAFTLLPFHFQRLTHLFYANYSACMWAVWLALRLEDSFVPPAAAADNEAGWRSRLGRWLGVVGITLAALWCGTTGVYFGFFACIAVGTAGALWCVERRSWAPMRRAAFVIAIIVAATSTQLLPSILFRAEHGENVQVAQRSFADSDIYGLRISQLLLPVRDHRIEAARAVRLEFDTRAPMVNENGTASLGFFGSAGLLAAILLVLAPGLARGMAPKVKIISATTIALLLFATMGGFGSLFSLLVSPQMRGLNRVSPMIAGLSIILVALLLQHLLRRCSNKMLQPALVLLLIVLVTLDQVPAATPAVIEGRLTRKSWFDADRKFGEALTAAIPPGAAVLQLPFVRYPESGSAIGDYRQFRNNLHMPTLRFTHGAMKGRPESHWLELLAATPPAQMHQALLSTGFAAVIFDTAGMSAELTAVAEQLRAEGWKQLDAEDATQFALLAPATQRPARAVAPAKGWHALEVAPDGMLRWIWSSGDASLAVSRAHGTEDCRIEMQFRSLQDTTLTASANGKVLGELSLQAHQPGMLELAVPADATEVELKLGEPPVRPGNGDERLLGVSWTLATVPVCR